MFEGEKNNIFFAGLFILGASLCILFFTLWFILLDPYSFVWKIFTPVAFASAVFLLIGYYLMTLGVRKPPPPPKS